MKIPQDSNVSRTDAIVKKWSKVLDYSSNNIAPIQNEHVYKTTAMLLENQEKWCIQEANQGASGGVFGATQSISNGATAGDGYASGDSRLPKILIPMIRRTFPELISNEICGVQPMGAPVGLAFALRYAYQSDTLANGSIDGKSTSSGGTNFRSGAATSYTGASGLPGSNELGYQLLDTRFTGTTAPWLTGSTDWAFNNQDQGIASLSYALY